MVRCHTCGAGVHQVANALGLKVAHFLPNYLGDIIERKQRMAKIAATFDYQDEHGNLLYQTVRYEPKDFIQRRPTGYGQWIYNLDDTPRVLYQLPKLLEIDTVSRPWCFICEGEAKADAIWELELPATSAVCGAKAPWRPEYNETLRPFSCAVMPDNDEVGMEHAKEVAGALLFGGCQLVCILPLPGVPEKGDIIDWLAGWPRGTPIQHKRQSLLELLQQVYWYKRLTPSLQ